MSSSIFAAPAFNNRITVEPPNSKYPFSSPLAKRPPLGTEIVDKNVILLDDVLYTGRTVRAAMDALFDHGRPRRVQLCVLIDRGHRELPIEAAFIGRTVQTTDNEIIEVKLSEVDKEEQVLLVERID